MSALMWPSLSLFITSCVVTSFYTKSCINNKGKDQYFTKLYSTKTSLSALKSPSKGTLKEASTSSLISTSKQQQQEGEHVYCTSDLTSCVDIRTEESGANSLVPISIPQLFVQCTERFRDKLALAKKHSFTGAWTTWTFKEYSQLCVSFAKSLIALGIGKHAAINILGFNSPEWFIANVGSMLIGCIPAGIYTTNSADSCHYITNHSQAPLVVVDGKDQLKKYLSASVETLPYLKTIVLWGDDKLDEIDASSLPGVRVYCWTEFLALGQSVDSSVVNEKMNSVKPGECAALIYTSGTTGPPKAVMLSHDNITWTCQIFATEYVVGGMIPGRIVSYLPLSHVAAQMIDIHYNYYSGSTIYFAQPDALKGSLSVTLKEVRPTVFFGVPRVWEKMEEKLKEAGRQSSGVKKLLATWAKNIGFAHCELAQFGHVNENSTPWGYWLANLLVLSKIKQALGFDCCRAFFTAAAPIAVETLHYFASLDIPLYELFGQSESTGPHTSSRFGQWRFGYCGRPLPGTTTKIGVDNGELMYRGRHIFMGYAFMPAETKAAFDSDGYLRSGDVAEFDNNDQLDVPSPSGFMKITGRIKELIITAGGENVPPVLIENEMKKQNSFVSNCLVIGDRRKYLVILISLKCCTDDNGEPTNELAEETLAVGRTIGSRARTVDQVSEDPAWRRHLDEAISNLNKMTTSRAQFVQRWALLPRDLSERQGFLTPTLKVKRNVVCDAYKALIDSLYV